MLVIPKVLAQNAGYDPQEVMVKLLEEAGASDNAVNKGFIKNQKK